MAAPALAVTFATADVGELTVRLFTATPAPSAAALLPASKCVEPPEIVTFAVWPASSVDGVTDSTVGPPGGPTTCSGPIPPAVSIEPSPRSLLTVRSRNPSGAPGAAVRRKTMRVGDSTSLESTVTPVPDTATVLPARNPVFDPV